MRFLPVPRNDNGDLGDPSVLESEAYPVSFV